MMVDHRPGVGAHTLTRVPWLTRREEYVGVSQNV